MFGLAVSIGIFLSFTPKFICTDGFTKINWQFFLIFPSAVSLARIPFVYVYFNHDSPIQYSFMQNEINYTQMENKINEIMCKFSSDLSQLSMLKGEIHALKNISLIERSFISNSCSNLCQRKKLWPLLAMITILIWPCITGFVFTSIYNTVLFDKLMTPGFSDK